MVANKQAYRIAADRRADSVLIDDKRPLNFHFDGKAYQGYEGDSLASALLANGVRLFGRSFKYHRARGIFACGVEEPNALIQLEKGANTQPDLQATMITLYDDLDAQSQNRWPSLQFDFSAVNNLLGRFFPAGFYYKTFMWPSHFWTNLYEKYIRKAAGLGIAPDAPDPSFYSQRYHHCDILIAGGGIAGIYAAWLAAKAGLRVSLLDENLAFGGYALSDPDMGEIAGEASLTQIRHWLEELRHHDKVTLLSATTLAGIYDDNYVIAKERVQDHLHPVKQNPQIARHRLWKIRANQILVAAGAFERPIPFANNDRPNIMLASAISGYINRYGVLPGKDITIFTNNDGGYRVAFHAAHAGAKVRLVDSRQTIEETLQQKVQAANIDHRLGQVVCDSKGRLAVSLLKLAFMGEDGRLGKDEEWVSCDCLGIAGGLNPIVHLYSQARGKLNWDDKTQCFKPDGKLKHVHAIGAANGTFALDELCKEAFVLVKKLAKGMDKPLPASLKCIKASGGYDLNIEALWEVPHQKGQKAFHDFQNDSCLSDVKLAAREGFLSVEHLKRYTTTGMATDQGKTSNVNALAVMAGIRNMAIDAVGTTTFRPPYSPVSFGAITGQNRRDLFHPERITPMHQAHLEDGAVFEDVGDWKRPFYFPQAKADGGKENMQEAVRRECLQTRQSVGMVDASTLGKIDIQGKDAAWFLNMIYTNKWDNLKIGRCRYGLMCNEHGMVFDDGVTSRIGENHFHMTTTTGGAARVMGWLEEWHQTEWPEKQIYFTSVTEQWAVASLNGPKARNLLAKLCDVDLSADAFPFMSWQAGKVAGIPARIFRISFTGELGFEINVPARFGLCLWRTLKEAGKEFDLCVYGTETLHVLRAEKGYIIAGQDTDGTVTPQDLGMSWIVSKKKDDFIGARSHSRSDTARSGRKQLVGLLTDDENLVLKEGAHIVAEYHKKPPMPTLGHVSSSYYSANLGRSIALALIKDGQNRMGEKVCLPDMISNKPYWATITNPVFYDKEGLRSDG